MPDIVIGLVRSVLVWTRGPLTMYLKRHNTMFWRAGPHMLRNHPRSLCGVTSGSYEQVTVVEMRL